MPTKKKVKIENLTSADFESRQTGPKIALLDIETAACVGAFWRNPWNTSIIRMIHDTYMLSFSFKWLGGEHITKGLRDYKGYKPGKRCDKALVTELQSLMNEADVIIAHNGIRFDFPYANGRFIVNGLQPTKRFKPYDTRRAAKQHFGFTSNKMDDIARLMGIQTKIPIHYETWEGCERGDQDAWDLMLRYNANDVEMLEEIYLRFRSWDAGHPNMNLLLNRSTEGCPSCGGTEIRKRGFGYTTTGRRQEYECLSSKCGRRFSGRHQKISDYR